MRRYTHPIQKLLEMKERAEAEGRAFAFEYNNGRIVKAWVGKQPKRLQGRCGAYCRSTGEPCKMRVVQGKRRCRLHGGLSTGPKTPEGRERIADANRRRAETRKANREQNIARGLEVLEELERRQREGLPLIPHG